MKLKIFALTTCSLMSACTTIVFDNGPQTTTAQESIKLRHHGGGIFALMEFSEPKNLQQICNGNDWDTITTEMSFFDGFIRQIVPWGIYTPRTTYTQCRTGPASFTSAVAPMDVNSGALSSAAPAARSASTTSRRYESQGNASSESRENLVGCSEKHKHLFFGCEE